LRIRVAQTRRDAVRRLGVIGLVAIALVIWPAGVSARSAGSPLRIQLAGKDRLPRRYSNGVARVHRGWVLSGSSVIAHTDEQLRDLQVNRAPIPADLRAKGYARVGDLDIATGYIYAALEQPNFPLDHQVVARYDLQTLRFVDSVVLRQHEAKFVAVDSLRMMGYSMDRSSGTTILRYDIVDHWSKLPPLVMDRRIPNARGAGVSVGAIWISTASPGDHIFRVDLITGHVDDVGAAASHGATGSGLDATLLSTGRLHAMVIDRAHRPWWLEHFSVQSATGSQPT
jgi:hypothetical protein